jgi:hypothetical protein
LAAVEKEVWITVTYEYLPSKPAGYMDTRPIWLDVTNCGISSVQPPNDSTFSLSMKPWTSNFDGILLGTGGHLHDGGMNVEVFQNKKMICDSTAGYGGAAYTGGGSATAASPSSSDMNSMEHISEMSTCNDLGQIKKGDQVWITANYDFGKHMGMKTASGKMDEVMGIAIMYAAVPFT